MHFVFRFQIFQIFMCVNHNEIHYRQSTHSYVYFIAYDDYFFFPLQIIRFSTRRSIQLLWIVQKLKDVFLKIFDDRENLYIERRNAVQSTRVPDIKRNLMVTFTRQKKITIIIMSHSFEIFRNGVFKIYNLLSLIEFWRNNALSPIISIIPVKALTFEFIRYPGAIL